MKSKIHSSGTSGTKRVLKTDIALPLLCWVFTSPFSNWTDVFTGTEVPEGSLPGLEQAPEAIFRFVLNDEGFDVGFDAVEWISVVSLSRFRRCPQRIWTTKRRCRGLPAT